MYIVKELAKLSGVSVRTLHFYDEIGLLKPARYGENGYRYYEREQLLLLQQILFFRELGFQLNDIQRVLGSDNFDKVSALKSHRKVLEQNAERAHELIRTIDKTIASLQGGKSMKPQEMYLGFDKAKQVEYEQYWLKKGGDCAKKLVAESKKNTKNWKTADYESAKNEFDRLDEALTEELKKKKSAGSRDVQDIVRRHFALIQRFYQPTREAYSGLGQMYADHPDFRKSYDAFHPNLAEFWAEAMKVFAVGELP
jgi:MerR family transcriptional regulator, thiopeptide resistance regulator